MLDRLARDAAASFVLTDAGRILRENDPDRSAGPRLAVLGCPEGNLAFVRHDVPDDVAEDIARAVAQDPPWFEPDTLPASADALAERLAPIASLEPSLKLYSQSDSSGVKTRRINLGLRATYRVARQVSLESELNGEDSKVTGDMRNETSQRAFYYLGGRYDF